MELVADQLIRKDRQYPHRAAPISLHEDGSADTAGSVSLEPDPEAGADQTRRSNQRRE
jgi:hypothetical protein